MATSPRPYLWQSLQLRASEVNGVGGMAHYFTEEAQSLYLHNGISTKELLVEDGHWQDAIPSEEDLISDEGYSQLSFTHPATGSIYGTAILPDEGSTYLYLLRYTYVKDIGDLINRGNYIGQVDNPIAQVNADIKNYDSDAFTKDQSLYIPSAKITLGLTMGDSPIYKICEVYVDQVDFAYNRANVSISARNRVGHLLSDQTINQTGSKPDTVTNLCEWVLDTFGVERYIIQENNTTFTLEYQASDTGLKLLQTIADMASGFGDGEDWDIEEMADGTIVIGFNAFRGQYLPKSVFKFGNGELFKRSSVKSSDGAYTKVYCAGKTSSGQDLEPVILDVTQWKYWSLPDNKTYFAPVLENTTQAELQRYAQTIAKQLKRTGLTESYNTTIKPQLLVGDYATMQQNGSNRDIGIINQITHSFGEKGFFTDFVADSGGDKKSLLTRSSSEENVYTSSRRMGGLNRNRRLYDFIRNTTKAEIRMAGGGGGGGSTSGVQDVRVNGASVVTDGVANVAVPTKTSQLTNDVGFSKVEASSQNGKIKVNNEDILVYNDSNKQDKLTEGDRISINQNVISASIAPFSIVNGEVCITYEEEV